MTALPRSPGRVPVRTSRQQSRDSAAGVFKSPLARMPTCSTEALTLNSRNNQASRHIYRHGWRWYNERGVIVHHFVSLLALLRNDLTIASNYARQAEKDQAKHPTQCIEIEFQNLFPRPHDLEVFQATTYDDTETNQG